MTISIIIPAYNCERFLDRCLHSVLDQEGAELDVIVINDGSSDSTVDILKKYQGLIRTKTTENHGASAARNEGIAMIRGEYTMFLDADDTLEEGAIKRLTDTLTQTDADIIKFRYRLSFPDGRIQSAPNQFDTYDIVEKKDFKTKIYPYFISGIRLNSMCVGIYRSTLIKGRSFRRDMRVAEDACFSLDTYTRANKVVLLPDILYNYYQTGTGLTGSGASIYQKYHCNFIFASETAKHLKEWGMDSPLTRTKVYLRPFFLTFDKVKRILHSKA